MGLLSSGAPITDTSALVRDRGLRVPRVGRLSYPRENLIDARQSAVSASRVPKHSTRRYPRRLLRCGIFNPGYDRLGRATSVVMMLAPARSAVPLPRRLSRLHLCNDWLSPFLSIRCPNSCCWRNVVDAS